MRGGRFARGPDEQGLRFGRRARPADSDGATWLSYTAGHVHDSQVAYALLEGLQANSVILADKGYDAGWIRAMIEEQGAAPIIPPRSNRKARFCFSRTPYPRAG